MAFLTISALPELQNAASSQYLLGEWCLPNEQVFHPPRSIEILPYPWENAERKENAFNESEALYEELLELFSHALNRFHSTDHPARYWRIILGPWLSSEIDILYDRYNCLKDARDRWGELTVIGPSFSSPPAIRDFSISGIRQFYGRVYQAKLVRQLAEKMRFQVEYRPIDYFDQIAMKQRFLKRYYTSVMRHVAHRFSRIPGTRIIGSGIPRNDRLKLAVASRFKIQSYSQMPFVVPEAPRSEKARERLTQSIQPSGDLASLFLPILVNDLPTAYLEGYRELIAQNVVTSRQPRTWLGGTAWFGDEGFKINVAEGILSGEKVYGIQHGGYYGTALHHSFENHERACADHYLTWGWKHSPKDVPYHSIALSRTSRTLGKRVRATSADRILFMATSHSRELLRFQSYPLGPQWRKYFEDQFTFFSNLPQSVRSKITVRLYPTEFGWNLKNEYQARFPEITLDTSPTSMEALSRCDLLIVDHPATTFLESLSADLPMIGFWREDDFQVRASAKTAFEKLTDAGIIFPSPELAAQNLPAIAQNCAEWWSDLCRTEARENFVSIYARTDEHWTTKLKSLFAPHSPLFEKKESGLLNNASHFTKLPS